MRMTSGMFPSMRHAAPLTAALALLAACTVSPTQAPPSQVTAPAAFDQVGEGGAPAADLSHWWTVWQDPRLNDLITAALAANPDIRIAQAHVAEARSMVTIVESALYPTVAANGGAWGGGADWRGQSLSMAPGLSPGIDGHLVGLAASWEPDIFNGRHDDVAAARAQALGVEEQLNGARMTVAADVAENYLEAQGLQRRLATLDASIATVERLLTYAQGRYVAGQALAYDVNLVRERLDTLRARRPPLLSLLDSRRRRLAVLTGQAPETAAALPAPGPFIAPPPPSGQMPVDVLERRPDVRARVALVQAQVARLASAKTDMLPRFQIDFLGQDGHLHFEGLPGLSGTGGLVGLTASLPIFTAGRIKANIAANDARLDAAVADYDKAVLQALTDVEDAYGFRHGLDQRVDGLTTALATARRNEAAATGLYEGGAKTLQDVLDARVEALTREDDLVQTQMGQATATVLLYRALGGGW